MNPHLPTLGPKSRPADAAAGLALPLRAFRLMLTTPRLFALSLVSAAVTAAALVFVGWAAWAGGQGLAQAILGGEGWRHAASVGLGVLLFIAFFVAGALTVPLLLLAPLQDPISEATEARLGGFTPPPFTVARLLRSIVESVMHTLLRLASMLLGFAVLFPLNLIPVAGSALWWVLSSTWAMFWIAVEQLSNPMARHLYRFGQVLKAARGRMPLTMGFGAAMYVILWVPVVNFFLMPVAVVSGTLFFRSLKAAGDLGEPGP